MAYEDSGIVNDRLAARMDAFDRGVEALLNAPGINPALDLVENNGRHIPEVGYIVSARVTPGAYGVIALTRYDQGLQFGNPVDQRRPGEEGGTIRATCAIPDGMEYIVAYEPAGASFRDEAPNNRYSPSSFTGLHWEATDLIDLASGGRLLDEKGGFRPRADMTMSVTYTDLKEAKGKLLKTGMYDVVLQDQVATTPEDLFSTIENCGVAMGMVPQDIAVLVDRVRTHLGSIEPAHDVQIQDNAPAHDENMQRTERSNRLVRAAKLLAKLLFRSLA